MRATLSTALAWFTCAAVATAVSAAPTTVYLRAPRADGNPGNIAFNGNATTAAVFDDTVITTGTTSSTFTNPYSDTGNLNIRTPGTVEQVLIGIKDLFTLVPATSGSDQIVITSATLHLFANGASPGAANSTVTVRRVTSDWLVSAAGTNESDVSGRYREISTTTNWSAGAGGFGTGDYTDTNAASIAWTGTSNFVNSIDVTDLIEDMYTAGENFGFRINTNSTTTLSIRSSDHFQTATVSYQPVLQITYDYAPIPEPATFGVVGGAALLALRRRRVTP